MEEPPKNKSRMPELKLLASASSIGLSMVVAIFLGVAAGFYLDKKLGTKPWCMLAGIVLGIVAAFNNFYILSKRLERQRSDIYGKDEERRLKERRLREEEESKRNPSKGGSDDDKGDGFFFNE
jgi:ATP synthase protein I